MKNLYFYIIYRFGEREYILLSEFESHFQLKKKKK